MNTSARPADGVGDLKPHQKPEPKQDQKIAAFGSLHRIGGIRLGIGRLSGRHREQAHSYRGIAGSLQEVGWLVGRYRWQASSHSGLEAFG